MVERLPPQDIEAEEMVLGSVLIDSNCLDTLQYMLGPDDFYREKHGWIYEAMLSLHIQHEPVDWGTVCTRLDERGQLNDIGGSPFILGLINTVPTSLHFESYANSIISCANRRRMIWAAGKIAALSYEESDDMSLYTKCLGVVQGASPTGHAVRSVGGTGDSVAIELLRALANVDDERTRIAAGGYEPSWPWPTMKRMARWRKGQPVGIIAEGGAGKTALCTEVAFYNAANGGRIFYVATEDEPHILWLRRLARIAGVAYRQIETGNYRATDEHGRNVEMVPLDLGDRTIHVPMGVVRGIASVRNGWRGSIYLVPATDRTIPEVIYDLKRLEIEHGEPDAVILDWFLDQAPRDTNDTVVNNLMADLKDLKRYASSGKRLLIATQTGKAGSKQARLSAYDAYFTSAFAHYCKLIYTLRREREKIDGEPVGPFRPEMEVFVAKANLDATGLIKLRMRGDTLAVYEEEDENGPVNY